VEIYEKMERFFGLIDVMEDIKIGYLRKNSSTEKQKTKKGVLTGKKKIKKESVINKHYTEKIIKKKCVKEVKIGRKITKK